MPHQVTKATARGSQGDLAKIADALHKLKPPVNIVAIGGGEGVLNNANGTKTEVGVISMILEPDDGATSDKILTTLRGLTLPSGKKLEDVEQFPNIHIQIDDKPGELKKGPRRPHRDQHPECAVDGHASWGRRTSASASPRRITRMPR